MTPLPGFVNPRLGITGVRLCTTVVLMKYDIIEITVKVVMLTCNSNLKFFKLTSFLKFW
jgi:hypothetical protein